MEDSSTSGSSTHTLSPKRPTFGAAMARQQRETEEGTRIRIYIDGEEKVDNYLGTVIGFSDPVGFRKKLARLKGRKPKGYVFSEAELLPLEREAEIGTFWRHIEDFQNDDGSPMEDTEDNVRKVMEINFIRNACNAAVTADETWQQERKEELRKNF